MKLEIYVASHCANCREARRIAEQARAVAGIEVTLIDLDREAVPIPGSVVAVPTYLLDGRVVSLGNPDRAAFLTLLARRTERPSR